MKGWIIEVIYTVYIYIYMYRARTERGWEEHRRSSSPLPGESTLYSIHTYTLVNQLQFYRFTHDSNMNNSNLNDINLNNSKPNDTYLSASLTRITITRTK